MTSRGLQELLWTTLVITSVRGISHLFRPQTSQILWWPWYLLFCLFSLQDFENVVKKGLSIYSAEKKGL